MNQTISSIPGAEKFRSIIVIIIILVCIIAFFTYTDKLSRQAEDVARDRVITDIKYALSIMLYDYVIKGRQIELEKFDQENPFMPLAIYKSLPSNYHGVVKSTRNDALSGWYYESERKVTVYIGRQKELVYFKLRYIQPEHAKVGRFEFIQIEK